MSHYDRSETIPAPKVPKIPGMCDWCGRRKALIRVKSVDFQMCKQGWKWDLCGPCLARQTEAVERTELFLGVET